MSEPTRESSDADGPRSDALWVLAPVPPPVTGLTVLTSEMIRAFQEAGPVTFLNWSPGMSHRNLRMRLRRNWRILISLVRLLGHGRVTNQKLYTPSNSGSGLFVTAFVVSMARWLGYRVYLHHHVYTYVDDYDWKMAWTDRLLGSKGVHVVHCQKMAEEFRQRYSTRCDFAVVPPSFVPVEMGRARQAPRRPLRLGLLSSLSMAKGVDLAVATLAALRRKGCEVTLTLAGAVPDSRSRRIIDRALKEFPSHVRHVGPLFGQQKNEYYREIDAFLFPTRSESWGLVLHEAMAAGVPVIAFHRGCLATVVGDEVGKLVPPDGSFVDAAAGQVARWVEHLDEYRRASEAAIRQAERLSRDGRCALRVFVQRILSDEAVPAADPPTAGQ